MSRPRPTIHVCHDIFHRCGRMFQAVDAHVSAGEEICAHDVEFLDADERVVAPNCSYCRRSAAFSQSKIDVGEQGPLYKDK